ncbi:hypothetical protein HYFRA_00010349 [Hymenoscyphus fraxineus]|uniref:DUF6594 domain-containing protein n=1 Tax=Hymenoscyphus fraxineus TaxID=746836 RepID=A0A9N9L1S4_9HELO|nr:hypothetical protein HYFRA_00010349 [Hymenoscyphus fraxineus]
MVKPLRHYPEGYPFLAALHDFEENFMVYRRFGFLQARLLLHKQEELGYLEEKLCALDTGYEIHLPRHHRVTLRGDHRCEPHRELMQEIEQKFKEYAQLLATAGTLACFNPPSKYNYRNVRNYFDERKPLCAEETYIKYKEDLLTLKPGREHSWLDASVEQLVQRLTKYSWINVRYPVLLRPLDLVTKYLRNGVRENSSPAKKFGLTIYSRNRIEITVALIIMLTILALLVLPIYILSKLTGSEKADSPDQTGTNKTISITIAILGVFTALFSIVLSLFTRAKRHEILASAAAYVAVLVVFIGNLGH